HELERLPFVSFVAADAGNIPWLDGLQKIGWVSDRGAFHGIDPLRIVAFLLHQGQELRHRHCGGLFAMEFDGRIRMGGVNVSRRYAGCTEGIREWNLADRK